MLLTTIAPVCPCVMIIGIGLALQWHARLVHSSGVNFGSNVRVAAIMDFRRCWPSSQLEWMVRTETGDLTMRVKGHEEGGETVGEASAVVREGARILPSLMWHHDVRYQNLHLAPARSLLHFDVCVELIASVLV